MLAARLLLLCAVVIWGCTFVATKICLAWLSPLELMGMRLVIGLPVLGALLWRQRVRVDLRGHGRAWLLGSTILGTHFYVQISGLQYTTATRTGWIIAVTPVVMALLAALLLGERVSRHVVAGIAVATAGILLLVSDGRLTELGWIRSVGDWLVLASAHTWALFTVTTRNFARSQHPLAVTFAVLAPVTAVTALALALRTDWTALVRLPAEPIVALLFLGVCGTALGHWFWQHGVAAIGAARAGTFLYLEPLSTTALAVPYLGERCGPFTIAGGALVLAGVWLAQRVTTRGRPRSAER